MTISGGPPPVPPMLPGLTYAGPIGAGGFADVHLYRQEFPARQVAVKVLRESASADGVAQFRAEANVMAQLAGHPSIVPIFQADVSADGRAYLVMEFCPPPHVGQLFRTQRLEVPAVLDTAVKIASAVETAHRVGILHRDIKPHNILTSAYGAPLLTDFGIASVAGTAGFASEAVSVPWSPPEAFLDPNLLDVRSDVYSLAATVYSLLAGRSPHEIPGGDNSTPALVDRIERKEPARIGRSDVPEALNVLLLRSMSKRLEDRPTSAMAFARAVQEIQTQLQLPTTRIEVLDASPPTVARPPTDNDQTFVKPISIIVPDEIAHRGTLMRPREITGADATTGVPPLPPEPDTIRKMPDLPGLPPPPGWAPGHAPSQVPGQPGGGAGASRRTVWTAVIGVLLAAAVIAVVVVALTRGESDPGEPEPTPGDPPGTAVITGGPVAPADLTITAAKGGVQFGWTNPDPKAGDAYLVEAGPTLAELVEVSRGSEPTVFVRAAAGEQVCVSVSTLRGSQVSDALTECTVAR